MSKETYYLLLALFLSFKLQLFTYCNLSAQEKKTEVLPWGKILEELNGMEDINETAKIKYLIKISEWITVKTDAPTKENISAIKTNRLKLSLANILIEKKKYIWVEEIYRQIDARKLNNMECRLLFELETISLLKYPDREISMTILESLRFLLKKCRTELSEKPSFLVDLFQFYKNKHLLVEALEIAEILWKNDEFHFYCGELHQIAYRLRWESKNTTHWQQAKNHFEIIEKDYPNSKFILDSSTNLIILQTDFESPTQIADLFRKKLFLNIENLSREKVDELLDALSNKASDPEIIQLVKEWYLLLAEKKTSMLNREIIISFLNEKCGLNINDLALFLNNGKPQNKTFSDALKQASIHKKIQYLVYWNSDWEPITDFNNAQTGFRYDPKTKTSYLISQNRPKQQIIFAYEVKSNDKIPDYIYLELSSLEGQNILNILFKYDGKIAEVDKVICSQEKKLIRISLNAEMQKSKKWQIIINNNSNLNSSLLEISAPTFLNIKNITELNKRIGE